MKIYDFILLILIILVLNLIIFNLSYKEGISNGKPGGNKKKLKKITTKKLNNETESQTAKNQVTANRMNHTTKGVTFGVDKVGESVKLVKGMINNMGVQSK